MNLQSTDFELFEIAPRFAQDAAELTHRWKTLQREAHPDRFASHGTAAQRIAMQWSVRINEAWQRLRDPLRRAAYLCELNGVPIDAEHNTAMPKEFLLRQMEWHERLDEARTASALDDLAGEMAQVRKTVLADCAHLLDESHDYVAAAAQVRALMFLERLVRAIDERRDASVDAMDSSIKRQ